MSDSESDYEKDENIQVDFDQRYRVIDDLMKMFSEGSFNDVCIKLHDGEIKANKSVLAARCEYFAATFRWKSNNNHDVEEIVVNDCSKKIMTRVIEYIFSGIVKAKDLNLLEFLELYCQVQKMFPGDELKRKMENFLKCIEFQDRISPPTNEEVAKTISLVENGNLQPEVMVELGRVIETLIIRIDGDDHNSEDKALALANLLSCGVIKSISRLKLKRDLGFLSIDRLQSLVPIVTEKIYINDVTNCDMKTLLDLVNCKELLLIVKTLSKEETEALVRAMTSRVETVYLKILDKFFSLDSETFRKYQGDGKCREIHIAKSTEYDLASLLDSVNCKELHLSTGDKKIDRLNQRETEALVRAMTSRVEIVQLGSKDDVDDMDQWEYEEYKVSLDFGALTKYKGDGKCREVHFNHMVCDSSREVDRDDGDGHPEEEILIGYDETISTWAEELNWDLNQYDDLSRECCISRKQV